MDWIRRSVRSEIKCNVVSCNAATQVDTPYGTGMLRNIRDAFVVLGTFSKDLEVFYKPLLDSTLSGILAGACQFMCKAHNFALHDG